MSKKLIAGAGVAAAFAVALAPLATFATNYSGSVNGANNLSQTDTLTLNVQAACAFGFDYSDSTTDINGVAHTDGGTGAWSTHTLSRDINVGTNDDNFGTTALTVVCNNATGYEIYEKGTALSGTGTAIAPATDHSASKSGWSFTPMSVSGGSLALESGFTAETKAAATVAESGNGTKLASSNAETAAAGDVLTIKYGVGVQQNQKAGTYTGTMTYTLVQAAAAQQGGGE